MRVGRILKQLDTHRRVFEFVLLVAIFFFTQAEIWRRYPRFKFPGFDETFSYSALVTKPYYSVTFGVCVLAFVIGYRTRWKDHDHGRHLRLFTMVLFGTFGFSFILAPYSLYFGNAFWIERALFLLGLLVLWFRPSFAPVMLVVSLLSLAPLGWGLRGLPLTDKRLLIDAATLVAIWIGLGPLMRWSPKPLMAALLSLVGASYYFPARQKVLLGRNYSEWIFDNKIENLMVISRVNGWMAWVEMDTWTTIAQAVGVVAVPMALVTLAVEFSGAALPFAKRLTPLLLAVFALFHLGVFATTGIFFWKWMIVELALALLVYKGAPSWTQFSWPLRLMMFLSVVYSGNIFRAQPLGWFDTPFDQSIDIIAVGQSGARYDVPSDFFAPQDIYFSQNKPKGYYGIRPLVATYGGTESFPLFQKLEAAKDPEAVIEVIDRLPVKKQPYKQRVVSYLFHTFENVNKIKRRPLRFLPYIPHIWQEAWTPEFNFQEPIVAVDIELIERAFKNGQVHELSRAVVEHIPLPSQKSE